MQWVDASPVSVVNEVRTLVRQQPDVILVKLQTPHMDGCDIIARLRSRLTSSPVIIAVSEEVLDEEKLRSLNPAVNAHLPWPVRTDLLVACMQWLQDLVAGRERRDCWLAN